MHKLYLSIIAFFFISYSGNAQKKTVYGYLRDSITHFAIPYGNITNGTSGKSVVADDKGSFNIELSPNDFVYATAKAYHYDTVSYAILFSDSITIYLSPAGNVLPGVTVTSRFTKYQLDSMRRKSEFEQNRGQKLPTISSANSSGFGIGINLDKVFKKKYRNGQENEKRLTTREKMAYIDYRFSAYIVAQYTGLKGDPLKDFINHNIPTYEWLREHPLNEDVMYYINERLKAGKATGTK